MHTSHPGSCENPGSDSGRGGLRALPLKRSSAQPERVCDLEEGWGGELTYPFSCSAAGEAEGDSPPPKRARGVGISMAAMQVPLSRALPGRLGGHRGGGWGRYSILAASTVRGGSQGPPSAQDPLVSSTHYNARVSNFPTAYSLSNDLAKAAPTFPWVLNTSAETQHCGDPQHPPTPSYSICLLRPSIMGTHSSAAPGPQLWSSLHEAPCPPCEPRGMVSTQAPVGPAQLLISILLASRPL